MEESSFDQASAYSVTQPQINVVPLFGAIMNIGIGKNNIIYIMKMRSNQGQDIDEFHKSIFESYQMKRGRRWLWWQQTATNFLDIFCRSEHMNNFGGSRQQTLKL